YNNLDYFHSANAGRGFHVAAGSWNRLLPAGPTRLTLEARHLYGAPIQELLMSAVMRRVTVVIDVNLKPDLSYDVRGVLAEGKDDVWLEEWPPGQRVGTKVEK